MFRTTEGGREGGREVGGEEKGGRKGEREERRKEGEGRSSRLERSIWNVFQVYTMLNKCERHVTLYITGV